MFFVVCFLHACSHNSDLQTTNIAIKSITSLSQKDMEKYIPPSLDYGELDEKASQLALECNGTREAEKRASLFIANPRQIDNILICYDYYHASMLSSSKVILHIRDLTNNKHLSFKNAGFSDISADKELILIAQKGKFFLFQRRLILLKHLMKTQYFQILGLVRHIFHKIKNILCLKQMIKSLFMTLIHINFSIVLKQTPILIFT